MKLTKSKLKQLIKEAIDEEELDSLTYPSGERYGLTGELPYGEERYKKRPPPDNVVAGEKWWVTEMAQLVHDVDALYKNMPEEGAQLLIENFQMWLGTKSQYTREEEYDEEEREV